jgi:uncharacterized protein YycO
MKRNKKRSGQVLGVLTRLSSVGISLLILVVVVADATHPIPLQAYADELSASEVDSAEEPLFEPESGTWAALESFGADAVDIDIPDKSDNEAYAIWLIGLDGDYLLDNLDAFGEDGISATTSMEGILETTKGDEDKAAMVIKALLLLQFAQEQNREPAAQEKAYVASMQKIVFGEASPYYSGNGTSSNTSGITPQSAGPSPGDSNYHYSGPKGIGTYPASVTGGTFRKGLILVTDDPAMGVIPTGHAAILYNANSNTAISSFPEFASRNTPHLEGVQTEPNDWWNSHATCFVVDCNVTNATQEAVVADWCYSQYGKPYHWNFWDTATRSKFYCSQLVWAGFRDKYGIDLWHDEGFGSAIHPMSLKHSPLTTLLYQHGDVDPEDSGWVIIASKSYYILSDGSHLKGGWRWTDSTDSWRYFAPTGVLISSIQVSPGSMLNTSKRMDMSWSQTAGAQMQIWSHTGGDNERWDLFTMDGTNWYIQSRYSEMYVAVPGGAVYNGAPIIQWTYTGGNEQKWRLVSYSDGSYQFRSALNTNYVIDVTSASTANATKLQLYSRNDTPAQRWRFMDVW